MSEQKTLDTERSPKTQTHIWVSEVCTECQGTGKSPQDPATQCEARCEDGLAKAKPVPAAELVKLLVQQQAEDVGQRLSSLSERLRSSYK
jgi:hypothetical protein